MASRLRDRLAAGKFALTAEITPPLSVDPADLMAKALPLKGLADAVNVTDGASARAHMDSVIAASLLQREGIEPILQLTARDRNRIALQSALVGASAMGVVNLLFLTGDDPKKGDQPDAKPVFDLDSGAIARTAVSIRDKGELPHGRPVGGKADFFIGVSDMPTDPKPDWAPTGLAKKIENGGQFAQTQFCMDAGMLRRYMARLADAGITLPLIVGVAPLASAKSARWIRENLFGSIIPDAFVERLEAAEKPKTEGRRICVEYIQEIATIPGVAGAHIMAPLNESSLPEVLASARQAVG